VQPDKLDEEQERQKEEESIKLNHRIEEALENTKKKEEVCFHISSEISLCLKKLRLSDKGFR
jgi:hypothetical protein